MTNQLSNFFDDLALALVLEKFLPTFFEQLALWDHGTGMHSMAADPPPATVELVGVFHFETYAMQVP